MINDDLEPYVKDDAALVVQLVLNISGGGKKGSPDQNPPFTWELVRPTTPEVGVPFQDASTNSIEALSMGVPRNRRYLESTPPMTDVDRVLQQMHIVRNLQNSLVGN